ncbi:MAG: GAF domain-containing protein [Deltaproteobacteria bacterium]|nr:GAF domain-containing protein [Deltaproteobacteria bacterium]
MKKNPLAKRPLKGKGASPQQAILDLGYALSSTLDLDSLFQHLAKGVKTQVGFDYLSVHRTDNHKADCVFETSTRQGIKHPSAPQESPNGSPESTLEGRDPVVWKDLRVEKTEGTEPLRNMGLRSGVGIPLVHENQTIGSLHVASKRPRVYGSKELRVLTTVAPFLASAMVHAMAFGELKKHNEELQTATEHKSQFLARMSHEIRTPLGVLIGFMDILHSETLGSINPEQKTALDKMQIQSKRLQKMINDVLNLSRIEEGTIPLEVSTFPAERIIESLKTLTDNLQRKSQLEVHWDVDSVLPSLTTDAPKLEEVLQNLIVNAFKYTPSGEIWIRVKDRPSINIIEFVVEDTGLGIAPQNLTRIFEGFHQIDATTSSQGVGLGLTIVKKYLGLMHGAIRVESEPGKGSKFKVTLPYVLDS